MSRYFTLRPFNKQANTVNKQKPIRNPNMTGRGEELNSGPPKINAWRPDYMSSLNHCVSFASGLIAFSGKCISENFSLNLFNPFQSLPMNLIYILAFQIYPTFLAFFFYHSTSLFYVFLRLKAIFNKFMPCVSRCSFFRH